MITLQQIKDAMDALDNAKIEAEQAVAAVQQMNVDVDLAIASERAEFDAHNVAFSAIQQIARDAIGYDPARLLVMAKEEQRDARESELRQLMSDYIQQ